MKKILRRKALKVLSVLTLGLFVPKAKAEPVPFDYIEVKIVHRGQSHGMRVGLGSSDNRRPLGAAINVQHLNRCALDLLYSKGLICVDSEDHERFCRDYPKILALPERDRAAIIQRNFLRGLLKDKP